MKPTFEKEEEEEKKKVGCIENSDQFATQIKSLVKKAKQTKESPMGIFKIIKGSVHIIIHAYTKSKKAALFVHGGAPTDKEGL